MNEALIKENKENLLQEQARLHKLLLKEGKEEGKGSFPGDFKPKWPSVGDKEDENATEVSMYQTSLSLTRDLEARYDKITAALERIEKGTYGKCKFGDEIEEDRLRAVPEADVCMKHSKS
jgi:RNA polymerase-binding transcription factor DksA